MNFLWDKVTEWLKELLIGSIMSNLTGLFDNVNRQVAGIADNVGATPQAWNGGVFGMIRNLSDNVILPIAGVILALVATLELIQMIVDRNNMHDMDTFMLAKWVFKTACAVVIVTNTWNIVMAVFDVAQSVVSRASGLVIADKMVRAWQARRQSASAPHEYTTSPHCMPCDDLKSNMQVVKRELCTV